jgi:hypothetical protein
VNPGARSAFAALVSASTLAAVATGCVGSRGARQLGCCIDLLDELSRADVRPAGHRDDTVRVDDVAMAGDRRQSLSAAVPSRVTFHVRIPRKAVFSALLGVDRLAPADTRKPPDGVAFHLGISDGRTYEELLARTVLASDANAWTPVMVDLGGYAGWQWSLFYRPSTIQWQIVMNAYPVGGGAGRLRALWAAPMILGDRP